MAVMPKKKVEVHPVVAEMYEAACRARGRGKSHLYMSEIGHPCDRKLWLGFRGYPRAPLDGRLLLLFELGSMIEDQMVKWLNAAGYEVTCQQESFVAHDGFFRGRGDGRVKNVTSREHILEVKSASASSFKAFVDHGVRKAKPQYYCQMQCYMGYSGLERALFLVCNKNTSDVHVERIYFNRDDFQSLHERAKHIISLGSLPDKGEDCLWCDYATICDEPWNAVFKEPTCGSCVHFRAAHAGLACGHPLHPHGITAEMWGKRCDDWSLNRMGLCDVPF